MTASRDGIRPQPHRSGSLRLAAPAHPGQTRRPRQLLQWGANDDLRINARHPAAPLAWLLYALAVPLVMLVRAANQAVCYWHGRHERALLRRQIGRGRP